MAHGLLLAWARIPEKKIVAPAIPFVWVAPVRVSPGSKVAKGGQGVEKLSAGIGKESAPEWRSLHAVVSVGNRPPPYPAVAIEREWEGTARIRVEFDEEGNASSVFLDASSGHSILDEAALEAARGWHVEGGRRALIVPVAFELSDES